MAGRDSSFWGLGDLLDVQPLQEAEPARGARRDAAGTSELEAYQDDPFFTWGLHDLLEPHQAYQYEVAEGSRKSHWDTWAADHEGVAYNATSNYDNSAVDSDDEGIPEFSENFATYASEKINTVVMPEFEALLPLLQGTSASSLLELHCVMQDKLSSPFPFHPTKCRCLATSYFFCVEVVLNSLHTIPPDPLFFEKLKAPLAALIHAIREGDSFLVNCESPPTQVDKALCLALSTDIVDHHLHDLILCMSVLFQALDSLPGPHFMSQEAWQAEQMHDFLKETWGHVDEKQDVDSIKMFLAKVGAEEKGEVCNGVNFISRRLFVGGNERNTDDVLPSYLWVDDPKDILKGIVRAVGNGSYGVVFKTRWMGGRFASKIFMPMEDDKLFVREAVIHAKLRHSNVVDMVCCTKSASMSKRCILVMELMHKNLRYLIIERFNSGTPFPLLAAVDIMLQIAKGMEYLHGLRIMHRDLKAENILVSRPSASYLDSKGHVRVKIGDFGISKVKQSSSMFSTKDIGATAWRAPEVFGIEPTDGEQAITKYSNKADVYSFAMVCYEVLTGKEPFSDPFCKRTDIHQKVKDGHRPTLPQDCPPALASYIERCWHGDPLKRPSFKQICTVLRYFKGCILCGDLESLASPLHDDNVCDLHRTVDEGRPEENIYHPVLNMMFEMYDCRLRMISKRSHDHQGMEGSAQPP